MNFHHNDWVLLTPVIYLNCYNKNNNFHSESNNTILITHKRRIRHKFSTTKASHIFWLSIKKPEIYLHRALWIREPLLPTHARQTTIEETPTDLVQIKRQPHRGGEVGVHLKGPNFPDNESATSWLRAYKIHSSEAFAPTRHSSTVNERTDDVREPPPENHPIVCVVPQTTRGLAVPPSNHPPTSRGSSCL